MSKDLADCTAADRPTSAAACTRVMESGRLPRNQFYIGYYNRGWSYYNDGENDKALTDFNEAVKHNPSFPESYYSRAVIRDALGERASSLLDLDRYLELKGGSGIARINRALLFRKQGEPDRALAELQALANSSRVSHKAAVLRALLLSDLGEQSQARDAARDAIAAAGNDASAYYARALIEFRERSLLAAQTDAEKAISLDDKAPATHTLLGRIAEERGHRDRAVRHYQRAISLPAKSIDARSAREQSQERLQALNKQIISGDAAPTTVTLNCRRFIPAASATIAVECAE